MRHSFTRLDREEALAATHNFLRFCSLCGIGSAALSKLSQSLSLWEEKRSPLSQSQELQRIQVELRAAQQDTTKLLAQTEAWAKDKLRLAELEGEALRLSSQLAREKARADAKAERLDQLRKDLNDIAMEKRKLGEQLASYRDLDLYVDHVSRFSLYTRTRMDYERSVMKLTPEQSEAVDGIRAEISTSSSAGGPGRERQSSSCTRWKKCGAPGKRSSISGRGCASSFSPTPTPW